MKLTADCDFNYWINDHVGLSSAGYNFPLAKGETLYNYSNQFFVDFILPQKSVSISEK